MADRYHTPDGWTIEIVHLAEGERLRIRHHEFYIADVASVDGLVRWIPAQELEHLEPDMLILTVWPRRPMARSLARASGGTRSMCTHRPCT